MIWAPLPAERTSWAPPLILSSMLWTVVPRGMNRMGRLLPGLMSALRDEMTASPTFSPTGQRM